MNPLTIRKGKTMIVVEHTISVSAESFRLTLSFPERTVSAMITKRDLDRIAGFAMRAIKESTSCTTAP